jgi:hypothetical protein
VERNEMMIRKAILVVVCLVSCCVAPLCGQQTVKYAPAQYSLNASAILNTRLHGGSTHPYLSVTQPGKQNENRFPGSTDRVLFQADRNDFLFVPRSSEFVNAHSQPLNLVWPLKRTDVYAEFGLVNPTEQFTAGMAESVGPGYSTSSALPALAAEPGDPTGQQQGAAAPLPEPLSGDDGGWHIAVSPYLWLPGVHGTIGAFGKDASFRASAGDLLSHFKFGLLGAAEARRKRILTTLDLMFMRLGDDKAVPFPNLGESTANLTANLFILTPKVGIRLIDAKKLKADFLTGIRFWRFSENLQFTPFVPLLNFSKSQNWVDPLVGGRIELGLSRKTVFTLAGDVGGWGTGSQLEYQVVGLLGYKLKRNMTLQGGYRYLYFDYERSGPAGAVLKTAMSGVVLGVTMNLK